MPQIAVQLYTLRDQLAENFESVVRHVAEIGYDGVETAHMYGESPEAGARLFRELGLEVCAAHGKMETLDEPNAVRDLFNTLGTKRFVCAWLPPERFETPALIREACDELNRANDILRGIDLELFYHNHWQEGELVEGKRVYQYMLEYLDPTVGFEYDVYWAQNSGVDPVAAVKELGKRAPLLHLKDGPTTPREAGMTALGEGIVDIHGIVEASRKTADWWIVELDRSDNDMMQAVEKSYTYLKSLA